jgi:cobalt/nickel transport system ATP-binding protein
VIRLERINHRYDGGQAALCGIDLSIAEGEKVVLLGSNGTGKTTLLRILNALIFPTEGEFHYRNQPIDARTMKDRSIQRLFRREVVLLFQNPDAMLFNPRVYEEIAFGLRQIDHVDLDQRVREWARTFGLTDHLERLPFELSAGEKQRVCLASLLAIEPKVLLLDEPTANLDPRSVGWLVEFLADLEATVITSTHNLSLALELGERAVVLSEDHDIVYDGPMQELIHDRDTLIKANLVHLHRHLHGTEEHRHYHSHDWN